MKNDNLPIGEKEWDSLEQLVGDLTTNFYPEAEVLDKAEQPTPGKSKYTWLGGFVLKYFGEFYKVEYTCIGNCAWTNNFDLYRYRVKSIKRVTRKLREVTIMVPEYGTLEEIEIK